MYKAAYAFKINNVFLTNGLIREHYTATIFSLKFLSPARVLNVGADDPNEVATNLVRVLHAAQTAAEGRILDDLHDKADQLLTEKEDLVDRAIALESASSTSRKPPVASLIERLKTLQNILKPAVANTQPVVKSDAELIVQSLLVQAIIRLVDANDGYYKDFA